MAEDTKAPATPAKIPVIPQTARTNQWVYFEVEEQPGLAKVWRGYHGWITSVTTDNRKAYILRPGYQRSRLVPFGRIWEPIEPEPEQKEDSPET